VHALSQARSKLLLAGTVCAALLTAAPAFPLPESSRDKGLPDVRTLLEDGIPVQQIPAARSAADFTTVDVSHVLLSTDGDVRYLLTLNRACPELRWARHVGVTASDNRIWAGFDALTADGQACQIQQIHRLSGAVNLSLQVDNGKPELI